MSIAEATSMSISGKQAKGTSKIADRACRVTTKSYSNMPAKRQDFTIYTADGLRLTKANGPFATGLSPFNRAFPVDDPFGVRRAILPTLLRFPDGSMQGVGTAFHVDGWGTYITADHVVDVVRSHLGPDRVLPGTLHDADPNMPHIVLMTGVGVVFGTVTLEPDVFIAATKVTSIFEEYQDPLSFSNASRGRVAVDIASLSTQSTSRASSSISLRATRWIPELGEVVLAFGYPTLKGTERDRYVRTASISEELYGAYGRVLRIFPEGRGEHNRGPGFEVEADWPSGMSGGPVFNSAGEAVGLVSSSIAPDGDEPGVGYATWLHGIPELRMLTPRLHHENPGRRFGYAVLTFSPWRLHAIFPDEASATSWRNRTVASAEVVYGSHRIGTDEFMVT